MNDTSNPNGPYGRADGIQIPSAATLKLTMFRNEIPISTGSGFLTESADCWYLITALHNFTGRNFFDRKCLSDTLATPNKFQAIFLAKQGAEFKRFEARCDLFTNGEPLFLFDWSEEGGDIAILRILKDPGGPQFVTMSDARWECWTAHAGLDVFALGYPSALDVSGTPVWKRISIASEPSQRVNGRKMTLTDGLTFGGMSGGPVLINQSQGFTDSKAYSLDKELKMRVLGVYGGRYDADKEKSGTLGFYWPMETVNAIITGERKVGDIDCE